MCGARLGGGRAACRTSPFSVPRRGLEKNQLGSYQARMGPRKTNQRRRHVCAGGKGGGGRVREPRKSVEGGGGQRAFGRTVLPLPRFCSQPDFVSG